MFYEEGCRFVEKLRWTRIRFLIMARFCVMSFFRLLLGFLLLFVLVPAKAQAPVSAAVPEVHLRFSLYEVDLQKGEADVFLARFRMEFEWDPAKLPDFDPKKLSFQNANGEVKVVEVVPDKAPPSASGSRRVEAFMVTGFFKGYLDFQDYPFDSHDLPILMTDPTAAEGTYRFVCPVSSLRKEPAYDAQFDGWKVAGVEFYDTGDSYIHPQPANKLFRQAVFSGFLIDVRREMSFSMVRLFIPIIIIWLMSYMGLFWDDSSPASRCGTAAIFAAIAFAIGSNQINPMVNYLTVMNVVFLGTYVNIGICFFLVTWMFWLKGRGKKEAMKKVWLAGVIACPLLALATILFSMTLSGTRNEVKSFQGAPTSEVSFRR